MNDINENHTLRDSYITLSKNAAIEYKDRKSVFHAMASPISSDIDANNFIENARKKYPDATHLVYAWILGGKEIRNKYTDDGEPSGTAGLPVLDILRKRGIEDAIIVVIRYFGGTLLGTGGLVKAYSSAAGMAVDIAGKAKMIKADKYLCESDYSDFEKINIFLEKSNFQMENPQYGEKVKFYILCPYNKKETLLRALNDITGGRVLIEFIKTCYIKSS